MSEQQDVLRGMMEALNANADLLQSCNDSPETQARWRQQAEAIRTALDRLAAYEWALRAARSESDDHKCYGGYCSMCIINREASKALEVKDGE